MPRSGTSLAEQIIASHKNVYGGGEIYMLTKLFQDKVKKNDQLNKDELTKIQTEYIYHVSSIDNSDKTFTDKAPLNFRWIGFIKILFPNSKIIHCTRNPKDNCLSLFKNIFEGGLNFSYDQKTLGTFYNLYSDLMIFWNKKFSNFIHEANYEKILSNQLEESKKNRYTYVCKNTGETNTSRH